jgi:hypothetical protein
MKIYDFFLFNHEIDLLALRIDYSKDTVEHFYAFESETAFSGQTKKLYSDDFKSKYPELVDFVTFINVDLSGKSGTWQREFCARIAYLEFAKNNHYGQIGIFGDLDEFVNPEIFSKVHFGENTVYRLDMDCLIYDSRHCYNENMQNILVGVITYSFCNSDLRPLKGQQILHGFAYHFQNFMSANDISLKIKSYSHSEYYAERYTNVADIEKRIKNKTDYLGRDIEAVIVEYDFSKYPLKLQELFQNKYKMFY